MSVEPAAWLTTDGVAAMLSLSTITLKTWRRLGKGPPFVYVGDRVRYQRAAVDAWLTAIAATGSTRRRATAAAPAPRRRA